MRELLVGLDVGTTYCKAVVLDSDGRELAQARARTPWTRVPTGAEIDPHAVVDAVLSVAAQAIEDAPELRDLVLREPFQLRRARHPLMGMSQTQEKPRKVVIAGDGYAGVMCANRLAGTLGSRVAITPVNPIAELVYAAGSGAVAETVPGIREHAHSVSSLDGARRLKTALAALPAGRTVLVVAYRWAKARNAAPVTASRAGRVNA